MQPLKNVLAGARDIGRATGPIRAGTDRSGQRMQNVLEDSRIKLASVFRAAPGTPGWEAMIGGDADPPCAGSVVESASALRINDMAASSQGCSKV
jgi:hypothetical protein